jgi:uncharacterized protein with FMN-binding domain
MLFRPCVIAVAIGLSAPALAQTTLEKSECTQANIDNTDAIIAKMKDGRQKTTATSEIATAKDMLKQGKIEDCKTSLLKAELQTK